MEDDGSLSLTLYVPVVGSHIDYQFNFLPVEREPTDILKTQLRDAEDEIEALKKEVRTLKRDVKQEFISLRSSINNANTDGIITWNHLERNSSPTTYHLSANNQEITILSKGWYQVSCRITGPVTGSRNVAIRRNGADVSVAYYGNTTGYNQSVSICDFMSFEANERLSIHFQSLYGGTNPVETENYLSIHKISS